MSDALKQLQQLLDNADANEDGAKKLKQFRALLAKLLPSLRYLNYLSEFPAGYAPLSLGTIRVLTLSPTQLFNADYNNPVFDIRGMIALAQTGTGKTNVIFNTVANFLLNPKKIMGPLGKLVPHQVFVVTKPSLVLNLAKDLVQIHARDDKAVLESWKNQFEVNTDGVEAVPFNQNDYVMSYAQFANVLLGRSNAGRLFWAGKSLKGGANCKISVAGIVPLAYHKTPTGYVAGRMGHSIAESAIVRRMNWSIRPPRYSKPTKANPEAKLLDVSAYQSLWLWSGEYPLYVVRSNEEKKRKYFYKGQPKPNIPVVEFNLEFDQAQYNADRTKLLNGLFKTIDKEFRAAFQGVSGYDKLASIENVTLSEPGVRNYRKLEIDMIWKARTNERQMQDLFADKNKLAEFYERLKRQKDFVFLESVSLSGVSSPSEGYGWKLSTETSPPKYVPLDPGEVESDWNPCSNITVIFDEAHLLPGSDSLEPAERADFDLISTAMRESNMVAFFLTGTLNLFPMMAIIQALHPKYSTEGGLHPNLPFEDGYEGVNRFQEENPANLLDHYLKYFDFSKTDPKLRQFGVEASFSALGKKYLVAQSVGLLSFHPDLKTQPQYFARAEYGGSSESGHVIRGIASPKHTRVLLQRTNLPWPRYRRIINFYNPNETSLEMPLRFAFGTPEFQMESFAREVIMGTEKDAPYCWFAIQLLKLLRDRDEEESKGLLEGEKLSRFTITTGIRDSHGTNMIAAILQAAGYQWIRITPRKLDSRQRLKADQYWAQNQVPPSEYRKVRVERNDFDTEHYPALFENYGPSPRRIKEGSIKFITYSTTLIGYNAVALTTVEELISLVQETDYRTPLKGKSAKSLRELEFFRPYNPESRTAVKLTEELQLARDRWIEFFDSISDLVIYFWPGASNTINDEFQRNIEVVKKANALWDELEEQFFFVRYLDFSGQKAQYNVRRLELPPFFDAEMNLDTSSVTNQNLDRFLQLFVYDNALDNDGKKELVQSYKELTNNEGETNNEIGAVLLGPKFESGIDVFGSLTMISVEPYSDFTSEEQKNGRNNRRGGLSEFRYSRWVIQRYAFALEWPGEIMQRAVVSDLEEESKGKELNPPTLESMGVEMPDEKQYSKKSLDGLEKYRTSVITSILRHPITDRRQKEEVITQTTILQPYQYVRIQAVGGNPLVEVLNLIGGLAMRANSVDLPLTEPIVPGEVISKPLKFHGKTIPAGFPTKYQLSTHNLQHYLINNKADAIDPNVKYLLDFYSLSQRTGTAVEFNNLYRANGKQLYLESNNVPVELPLDLFRATSRENLLLQLVKLKLAVWHSRPIVVKKKKTPKRKQEGEQSAPKKRKSNVVDLTAIPSKFLHFRIQPQYGSTENSKKYVDAFFKLSEGDLEQASIQKFLHSKTIAVAISISKWNNQLNAETAALDAVDVIRVHFTKKATMDTQHQRAIQHALSVMQYYGMLNWNLSIVILVGIYLEIADKDVSEDFLNAAVLGAHCYRCALTDPSIFIDLWDIQFSKMNVTQATAFLDLIATWELGNFTDVHLSTVYRELRDNQDETLMKIFSELYSNFNISIQHNLPLFARILDVETPYALTAQILSRIVSVSKTQVVFTEGIQGDVMRKLLKNIVDAENVNIPYADVIADNLPKKSSVYRVVVFLELDPSAYVHSILTSENVGVLIGKIWPSIQLPENPMLRDLVNYYGQVEAMKEDMQERFETGKKPPASLDTLVKKLLGTSTTDYLPFISTSQRGKVAKDVRIRYRLSQPDDLQSSVVEVTKLDSKAGGHDTGRSIVHMILDGEVIYSRKLNGLWKIEKLNDELIPIIIEGHDIDPELKEVIQDSFPAVFNGKTFQEAKGYIVGLCFDSGILEENSNLAEQLRDRFAVWIQKNFTFGDAMPSVTEAQKHILSHWLVVSPAVVDAFREFLKQISPKASFYWELFRLAHYNNPLDGPDTETITELGFREIFLEEFFTRDAGDLEINKIHIDKFAEKFGMLQSIAPQQSVGDICHEIAETYKRSKKPKVPGVGIYVAVMKTLMKTMESRFYQLEGVDKIVAPKKGKNPKRIEPEPVVVAPPADIMILDEESEDEEKPAKKQKPSTPPVSEEEQEEEAEQEESFGFDSQYCSVCFLELGEYPCGCEAE